MPAQGNIRAVFFSKNVWYFIGISLAKTKEIPMKYQRNAGESMEDYWGMERESVRRVP